MAKNTLNFTVTVKPDEKVIELYEIASLISELNELVPEWNQYESEKIVSDIKERMGTLITTKN